jgi:sarcosine oxidase subunit beta
MVGLRLPVVTHPLQACVTESLKPFLDPIVGSQDFHIYLSQVDRGELVMGSTINPYQSYSMRSTLGFLEELCSHVLELFPSFQHVRILRQWSGLCDITPDFNPIMGTTPIDGFTHDVGWGTYGFKAAPIAGKSSAEVIATGRVPELIKPFALSRFENDALIPEDTGGTSH